MIKDLKSRNKLLLAAASSLLLLLLQPVATARAHPADMYAQTLTLQVMPDGLHMDWKIAPGPFLSDAVWGAADADGNGSVSQAETRVWLDPYLNELSVKLDGAPLAAPQIRSIVWPAGVDGLRTGESAIEATLLYAWPVRLSDAHSIEVHNGHLEGNSLNWFTLTSGQGLTFDPPVQNNGLLKFTVHASSTTGLTSWDSGTPNLTGFTNSLTQKVVNLAAPAQPQASSGSPTAVTSALTALVKTRDFSPLFLAGAFLLSLALGSLHALTPGHGKALVGAYLVGSQGRTRDAVFLGLIVTATHTGSVLALGLVTLLASHYILPALITPWLEILSGLLVIGFGINLLLRRRSDLAAWLAARRNPSSLSIRPAEPHRHALSLAPHTHSPSEEAHTHPHAHPDGSAHGHTHALPANQVTLRSLLTLGISGGLVPCPDAIAILLVAVAVNRIPLGMLLIVSFSIGLALVLIGIGLAMVHGLRLISHNDLLARFSVYAPAVSAVAVTGLGVALTLSALNSFRFSAAVLGSPSKLEAASGSQTSSAFDLTQTKVLYIASDSQGWDQLFMQPLSGGSPVQYTQEPSGVTGYSLSPDGSTILYTTFKLEGGSSIWSIKTNGSDRRMALDCPQAECNSPAWYPDGQRVAYERMDDSQDASIPRFSIWWLDMGTGKTEPVFQDGAFASSSPEFSPDGQWLSYLSAATNTMMIYNLKDGHSLSVPLGNQSIIPESWSPAGDALLFGNPASAQDGAPAHIKLYSLASGQTVDLGGPEGVVDYAAAWSPDGGWIAIDRSLPAPGGAGTANQVWLVKPDGTQAHVLLAENGASYSNLSWSPDGRYLLYTRYTLQLAAQGTGRFDVGVIDIHTGASRLAVPGGDLATFLK